MLLLYVGMNIIFATWSKILYKKMWNPMSVYIVVWVSTVSLYVSGLIQFYPLTQKTWMILFGTETLYMLGCMLGRSAAKKIKYRHGVQQDEELLELFLRRVIVIFSVLVAVVTFVNIWNTMRVYGFNLIANVARVYRDSITGRNEVEKIFFIDSLNFVSLVLSGIYISKFKFRKFLIVPMILAFAGQIVNGSRGSLMSGMFLFLASAFLFGFSFRVNKKKLYRIVFGGGVGFLLITYFRGINSKATLPYASELLKKISGGSSMIYRIVDYIAVPLGCLNQYLKAPIYGNWGSQTFRIFRRIMEVLGMEMERPKQDLGVYYTPLESNVVTYVGELIYDFKIPGALFVCCLLGMLFSYSYTRYEKDTSMLHGIWVTAYFYVVCLSFFAWYARLAIFWYVVILGGVIGFFLDRFKLKKIRKK